MKKINTIVALAVSALISYPVLAQDKAQGSTSGKTRAEVKAETARAGKAGELNKNTECVDTSGGKGTRSRAEVRAEAREAVKSGQMNRNIECDQIPSQPKSKK